MGIRATLLGAGVGAMIAPNISFASDIALIIGNTEYRNFTRVIGANAVLRTMPALERAGYRVISVRDGTEAAMKQAVASFENELLNADRAVVVLSGQFLNSMDVSWFAPTDLRSPSLGVVGFDALSLNSILGHLAQKPGGAALFLGTPLGDSTRQATINKGIGSLNIPQGVTVVRGTPAGISAALQQSFLTGEMSIAAAASVSRDVEVEGFVSEFTGLGSIETAVVSPIASDAAIEEGYWKAAQDLGSKASFLAYLRKYPFGEFEDEAREMIRIIEDSQPKYSPEEQTERNLKLSRSDRRRVQEQLSLLGFNPRGIDGVLGRGSRKAISNWQGQNGEPATGYLTVSTIKRLRSQAEARARKLAEDAERKKAEREAADAAFWQRTGANGQEADLQAYLAKYPNGIYASHAKRALARIERDKRDVAQAGDTQAWDRARGADTIEAYGVYLQEYPRGAFSKAAEARIRELRADVETEDIIARAQKEEAALGLNGVTRLLIEGKLGFLKMKPGRQDGQFDDNTRAAFRRYQETRGLPVTGYLNRAMISRLMSE